MSGEDSTASVTPGQDQWQSSGQGHTTAHKESARQVLQSDLGRTGTRYFLQPNPSLSGFFHEGIFSRPQPGCEFSANCFSSYSGGMKWPSLPSRGHWSLLSAPEAAWEGPVKWAGTDTLNSSTSPQGAITHITHPSGGSEPCVFPCPLPKSHFSCCHPAASILCCLLPHQNPIAIITPKKGAISTGRNNGEPQC